MGVNFPPSSSHFLLSWYSILLDTAVVCVLRMFSTASSSFQLYPYPSEPYPPSSCVLLTLSR